ncbi:casein kinase II, regulatory subunit [Geranomyces variabilis]|nr:casein kinase II, regulatory subunit [Geranomyces variabilis]KAJ3139491.1 casein kinase 2 regulatory subunit [Geranomyces variabilis]
MTANGSIDERDFTEDDATGSGGEPVQGNGVTFQVLQSGAPRQIITYNMRGDDITEIGRDDGGFPNSHEMTDPESEESLSAEDSYDETDSESGSSIVSWISWYCSLPGHEYFVEVPDDFVEDEFNLTGLQNPIPYYNEALDLILDADPEDAANQAYMTDIESSAEMLYGLIHARFILTKPGLQLMAQKAHDGIFGECPRVYCGGVGLLPTGLSDRPGEDTIKMVCGRCRDVYFPKEAKYQSIDGAFFGTTFANFLWMTYPELLPPIIRRSATEGNRHIRPPRRRRHGAYIGDGEGDDEDDEDDDEEDDEEEEEERATLVHRGHGGEDEDSEGSWYAPLDDPAHDAANVYEVYRPRIFGFGIHPDSVVAPRMQWLRWKEGVEETQLGR